MFIVDDAVSIITGTLFLGVVTYGVGRSIYRIISSVRNANYKVYKLCKAVEKEALYNVLKNEETEKNKQKNEGLSLDDPNKQKEKDTLKTSVSYKDVDSLGSGSLAILRAIRLPKNRWRTFKTWAKWRAGNFRIWRKVIGMPLAKDITVHVVGAVSVLGKAIIAITPPTPGENPLEINADLIKEIEGKKSEITKILKDAVAGKTAGTKDWKEAFEEAADKVRYGTKLELVQKQEKDLQEKKSDVELTSKQVKENINSLLESAEKLTEIVKMPGETGFTEHRYKTLLEGDKSFLLATEKTYKMRKARLRMSEAMFNLANGGVKSTKKVQSALDKAQEKLQEAQAKLEEQVQPKTKKMQEYEENFQKLWEMLQYGKSNSVEDQAIVKRLAGIPDELKFLEKMKILYEKKQQIDELLNVANQPHTNNFWDIMQPKTEGKSPYAIFEHKQFVEAKQKLLETWRDLPEMLAVYNKQAYLKEDLQKIKEIIQKTTEIIRPNNTPAKVVPHKEPSPESEKKIDLTVKAAEEIGSNLFLSQDPVYLHNTGALSNSMDPPKEKELKKSPANENTTRKYDITDPYNPEDEHDLR